MKIELFLEKLNSDSRIKEASKDRNGYKVILEEGYMFGELNRNSISYKSNQQDVMEYVNDIVERSEEEVKRYGKIKRVESEIESCKRSITWDNARMEEQKNIIKNNHARIRDYETSIKCCKENIFLAEQDIGYYENSISKENERILELQKELEEIEKQ